MLPRTGESIEAGLAQGLHIGAQLYVSSREEVIANSTWGLARQNVGMTPQTLMLWQSAGKPLAAIAIGQLWEQGKLELDDPVARHIPEFGAAGKDRITIRHLLTHTAGLRPAATSWSSQPCDQILARIYKSPVEPNWIVGQTAGYHIASTWFVLAEIIQRLSGESFDQYVRKHIFLPAGMHDSWFAMDAQTYAGYGELMGVLYSTEKQPGTPQPFDTIDNAATCRPGASLRCPARDLGRFYEMLLARGLGILRPQTVEALTARHRTGLFDQTFRHTMDWGLGFIVNSSLYGADSVPYSFGRHASQRTFGHGGAQSSVGFADPEHGLAVALLFNGMPGEARHHVRVREVLSSLYEDLGLT